MNDKNQKIILLVDDEAIIAISGKISLEKYGYNVITANSGQNAFDIFKENNSIDLILMDINLGEGFDGTETALMMLKEREIPIVFLSSHTEPEIVEKTEKITSYGYVVKNSGITVLDASIKMAFKLFEANKKTQKTKNKLEAILNALPDLLIETGLDGYCFDYYLPRTELIYTQTENIIGKKISDIFPTDVADMIMSAIKEAHEKKFSAGKQFEITTPTGKHWFEISVSCRADSSDKPHFIILSRDITQRKNVEDALHESDDKYRTAFMTSPDAININAIDGRYVDINEGFTKLTGFTREDVIGVLSSEISIWSIPEDRINLVNGLTETGSVENLESLFRCKDGSMKTALMSARIIKLKNEPHILSITRDITERKLMEISVQENEEKYRNVYITVKDALLLIDSETSSIVDINDAAYRLYGYSREEMLKLKNIDLSAEPGNTEYPSPQINDRRIFRYHKKKDGTIFPVDISASLFSLKGRPVILAAIRDITEPRRVEEALRESEDKYRTLVEKANEAIIIVQDAKFVFTNRRMSYLLGVSDGDLEGRSFIDFIWPEDRELGITNYYRRTVGETIPDTYDFRIIGAGGTLKWVLISATLIQWKGKPATLNLVTDITERKLTESALRKSEAHLHTLIQTIPDLIWLKDQNGIYISCNTMFEHFFGASEKDIVGKTDYDFVDSELADFFRENDRKAIAAGNPTSNEEWITFADDGHSALLDTIKTPMFDENGTLIGVLGIGRDITDRKFAEDKIKSLLAEKEIILKEVHHRIKNNMNTIYGLLTLQAGTLKDSSAIAALADAGSRVQSMMMLYDKLYLSAGYNELPVQVYLPALMDEIIAIFPNRGSVKIQKNIDDFVLGAKVLHPLGIIINELLTNIMKYAFTGIRDGIITVSASLKDKNVYLIIQDNGNGMPESIDFENSTGFGLMLVGMLTKQLDGTIRIERVNGTRIILEFKL